MRQTKNLHVAVFLKSLQGGGAERVMLSLASAFAQRGCRVDLLLGSLRGHLHKEIDGDIAVEVMEKTGRLSLFWPFLRLARKNGRELLNVYTENVPRIVKILPAIERYLKTARPNVIVSTLPSANIVAAWAIRLAGTNTSLVLREANYFSRSVRVDSAFNRLIVHQAARWYGTADHVIAVSRGVKDDLVTTLGIPAGKITSILNPVDVVRIRHLGKEEVGELEGFKKRIPFVLAVGKLEPQKDYQTLLKAYAIIRHKHHRSQLVILGSGALEVELQELARQLDIAGSVVLPGHVDNPYAYMCRASAFVLSSVWEGCPNVLLEAMACGCPIISTDCPSGPREVLEGGRYGMLVPVGDVDALAAGLDRILSEGGNFYDTDQALKRHTLSNVAEQYLDVLRGIK